MSLRIRPYIESTWRKRPTPQHDPAITEIDNWPHVFDEHPDRWDKSDGATPRERVDYAGCRKCGASELSAIHLAGPT